MPCSPLPETKHAVRSPVFSDRISAPVTSSSVRLLASSLRTPLSTRMGASRRKPASRATCGLRTGSIYSTCTLGEIVW